MCEDTWSSCVDELNYEVDLLTDALHLAICTGWSDTYEPDCTNCTKRMEGYCQDVIDHAKIYKNTIEQYRENRWRTYDNSN